MKYLEIRRHTDNDADQLSAEGVAAAEEIGRSGLHPPYALFVSTGAARAEQMLAILRDAAGQDDAPLRVEAGLRSTVEERWRAASKATDGGDLEAMRSVDPDLVERESALLGAALRGVVEQLPEGGRALVVGHSPTNEAAVLGLTGQLVPPLGKGEGVVLTVDDGAWTLERLAGP
jgi:phosphohistidine phosphatase SixA